VFGYQEDLIAEDHRIQITRTLQTDLEELNDTRTEQQLQK